MRVAPNVQGVNRCSTDLPETSEVPTDERGAWANTDGYALLSTRCREPKHRRTGDCRTADDEADRRDRGLGLPGRLCVECVCATTVGIRSASRLRFGPLG